MKVVFLIECGAASGLGHLRRCQVLARAMMRDGWTCRLGLSDADMVDAVRSEGFDAQTWKEDGLDMAPADILVVDGYHYPPQLLTSWRSYAGVRLVIDDLAERPVIADVVLNHNLYGGNLDYTAYGARTVIGGADYVLVDDEFFAAGDKMRPEPAHVLVSFGGTDDGRYSIPVAKGLLEGSADAVVEVVISPLQTPSADFITLQQMYGLRMFVHLGANMADVMSRCRVLAGAAGVTVVEALAAGLSLAVCASADNQRINVAALRKLGFAAFDEFDPDSVTNAALVALSGEDRPTRVALDGQGPRRIMDVLMNILADKSRTGTDEQ